MAKIHLLLLDDSALTRVALTKLLDEDPSFHVNAECSCIEDALKALARKRIDVALVEHELENGERGLEFFRRARQAGYSGRMFLLTSAMKAPDCIAALAESVCGIFFKQNPPDLLVDALLKAMAGQTWIDPRCIQVLKRAVTHDGADTSPLPLTDREVQVLKGVSGGLRNRQIGAQLSISEASVKSALQQLFVKTGVRTRTQLVRVALEVYGDELGQRS